MQETLPLCPQFRASTSYPSSTWRRNPYCYTVFIFLSLSLSLSLSPLYLSVSSLILVPLFHSCVPSFFPLRGCCKAPARVFVCAYIYMHLVRFLSTFFSLSFSLSLFFNAARAYRRALAVSWEYEPAFLFGRWAPSFLPFLLTYRTFIYSFFFHLPQCFNAIRKLYLCGA